jgi:isopentenyl-diphosphate delta-isomerase
LPPRVTAAIRFHMNQDDLTHITSGQAGIKDHDPTAPSRKQDHIELAFRSRVSGQELDDRFSYEPLLAAHPGTSQFGPFHFAGKQLDAPVWVSSMTGGTQWASHINANLARACREFGMGMGLGSCRSLLTSDEYLADFHVRPIMGPDLPLYANLGVAQVEQLFRERRTDLIHRMLDKLSADGLIVHVNPLQEWLQPEGDRFEVPPIETIERLLEHMEKPVIVKEVGQGMGRESLRRLLMLPLAAIEFAAAGGTNFALLELMRADPAALEAWQELARVGHSAPEMAGLVNELVAELGDELACQQVIASGGVRHFLDGYYLIRTLNLPTVYGQASAFLKHAREDYETLRDRVEAQIEGLKVAFAYLTIKES